MSGIAEDTSFHHPDRLGTRVVTQVGGLGLEQSTLPFGTAMPAESSSFTNQVFTSYDRSATTGLDYAINRTYSQGQSRFTQVDPIGMASASVGNPQSNNLYAYVQNMPTDFVDPLGLLYAICRTYSQWVWTNTPDGPVGTLREWTECTFFGGGNGPPAWHPPWEPPIGPPGPPPGTPPTTPPHRPPPVDQQKGYDDCVWKAWKDSAAVYATSGALVATGTFLTLAPFALVRILGKTAEAAHVGATVGRPAMPVGVLMMKEGFRRNAIAERERDIANCKKLYPGARH